MNKEELFQLYKRVMSHDREAEDLLIAEHHKKFPRSRLVNETRGTSPYYRSGLHARYLHLTR